MCHLGGIKYVVKLSEALGDGKGACGADVEKVRVVVERERRGRVAKFLLPFCPGYPLPPLTATFDATRGVLALPEEIADWDWQRDSQ